MAQSTTIEWTDATWNPVAGCTPVSPGCLNCYAARLAWRLGQMPGRAGVKYSGMSVRRSNGRIAFNGEIRLDPLTLQAPREWKQPKTIFVNSMSDLFHDKVPLAFVATVFEVMHDCPQHVFQVLTKRPERVASVAAELRWPANLWMGTSVESDRYFGRIRAIRKVRQAAVRFLSCEPLLGPLERLPLAGIDWVIVGGESGPGARPMSEEWVKGIRVQCGKAAVPFFFKQWGGPNKSAAGRLLQGRTWDAMPRSAS